MPEFNQPRRKSRSSSPERKPKPQMERLVPNATPQRHSQSKKTQKKRKKGRRNLVIYYVLFLIILLVVLIVLSLTILFPIKEVVVEGESQYSDEELLLAANIPLGENIIRYNTKEIEESIYDSFHALDSVVIGKKLTGAVVITVRAGEAVANVQSSSGFLVVSKSGRIMEAGLAKKDLPKVFGYEADPKCVAGGIIASEHERKAELAASILATMEKVGIYSEIDSIDITDYLSITLRYQERINIAIGISNDLHLKLATAKGLLDSEIDTDARGTLWVTTPEIPRFRPEAADEYILPGQIIASESEENSDEPPDDTPE